MYKSFLFHNFKFGTFIKFKNKSNLFTENLYLLILDFLIINNLLKFKLNLFKNF